MFAYWKSMALRAVRSLGVPLLVLLLCGVALGPLTDRIWPRVRATQPELNLIDLQDGLGQGMLVGVLGGFRSLIADFVWIAGNADWERCDRPKVEAMIKLATTLDPANSFFWRNGAQILAYDIRVWRLREAKLDVDDRTSAPALAIRREQGERGIALLDTVIKREPNNAWAIIAKAQIYNLVLGDLENAAKYFKQAWETPNAPYFTARVYAELLVKMGRAKEAYDYLRQLYDTLPKNDQYAARDIVYERIRELEKELNIPEDERYKGEPPPPVVVEVPKPTPEQKKHSH